MRGRYWSANVDGIGFVTPGLTLTDETVFCDMKSKTLKIDLKNLGNVSRKSIPSFLGKQYM
jgi:hypothetical protein